MPSCAVTSETMSGRGKAPARSAHRFIGWQRRALAACHLTRARDQHWGRQGEDTPPNGAVALRRLGP